MMRKRCLTRSSLLKWMQPIGAVLLVGCLNSSGGYVDDPGSNRDARDLSLESHLDFSVVDSGILDLAQQGDRDGGVRDGGTRSDAAPAPTDPFDPASCLDPALSSAQALTVLGMSTRRKLADATLYRRTRTCTGMSPPTCGAWSSPVPHTQDLLTYSGGVTTAYKNFAFPTHLILFSQAGTPKWTIRHETDYRHDATANNRGVGFSFGSDPMVNTYPVIYVWDFAPAPNRYDDLQGLLGEKAQLHAAEHCARVVFTSGITTEIAALYTY